MPRTIFPMQGFPNIWGGEVRGEGILTTLNSAYIAQYVAISLMIASGPGLYAQFPSNFVTLFTLCQM